MRWGIGSARGGWCGGHKGTRLLNLELEAEKAVELARVDYGRTDVKKAVDVGCESRLGRGWGLWRWGCGE